jgi:mevalonate kinase
MRVQIQAPSKTFLTGEYAILKGGVALIATTSPYFKLTADKVSGNSISPFHAESPAGMWWRQSEVLLRDWRLEFHDPFEGRGGFGASGAQFALLHSFTTWLQCGRPNDFHGGEIKDLWNDFRVCDQSHSSGADVTAQAIGAIAEVKVDAFAASSHLWPFPDADFFIFSTGVKTATHLHIQTKLPDMSELIKLSFKASENFHKPNLEGFAAIVADIQNNLCKLGLQTETAMEFVETLNGFPGVLAAKGCGAMGDNVVVLVEGEFRLEFLQAAHDRGFKAIATAHDLAKPLSLRHHL